MNGKLGDHRVIVGADHFPVESGVLDPDTFEPARFIDQKPHPYAWLPFGGGERRCIGMAFAFYEMRVVLATVLSQLSLRAGDEPLEVSLRSFTLVPKGGSQVVLTARAA